MKFLSLFFYFSVFFLTLTSVPISAQSASKKIDSLFVKLNHPDIYATIDDKQMLALVIEAYDQAKAIKYKKGEMDALIKMMEVYFNTGNVEEVVKKFPETKAIATEVGDRFILARALRYNAWAMTKVGQYSTAYANLEEASDVAETITDYNKKNRVLMNINSSLASYYEAKSANADSMLIYATKAYNFATKLRIPERAKATAGTATVVGSIFMYKKNLKDAKRYMQIARTNYQAQKDKAVLIRINKTLGGIAVEEKDYPTAVADLTEAIRLAKQYNQLEEVKNILPMLAAANENLKKYKKSVEALNAYKVLADSVDANIKQINNHIATENKKLQTVDKPFSYGYIILIILAMLGGGVVIAKRRNDKKPYTEPHIVKKESNPSANTDSELNLLAINRLAELAKTNEHAFYTSFQEVFPEFSRNLLEKFPTLSKTDIRLASYLKINFDTKEIATVTNTTMKSVEAKKYRFRKKIELPSNVDLYQYISEF